MTRGVRCALLGSVFATACTANNSSKDAGARLAVPILVVLEASASPHALELVATASSTDCVMGELETSIRTDGEAVRVRVDGFPFAPKTSACLNTARARVSLDPKWLALRGQRVAIEVGHEVDVYVLCADGRRIRLGPDGPLLDLEGTDSASRLPSCVQARPSELDTETSSRAAAIVSIISEPSGAEVHLGELIGTTPYVATIKTEAHVFPLRVDLPGYAPWVGALRRNESGHFTAEITLQHASNAE
ncbi:MAG: PEGA domain-containing protein [Deltaproteobacteria bacterium]|nr:PEGA domain-containing protein [Deltaproteobacteria bacterium]